ncbi:hypothetical protein [uncultured Cohaesibacter sp.]|uniref:hypothetical protein n=1 Tax=uncultured Cohaesibacter sp. TaxID=1002546 RepID=UPI0029C900CE|nr:hypothetical protein [uncultured Cohaesibacter sp.]
MTDKRAKRAPSTPAPVRARCEAPTLFERKPIAQRMAKAPIAGNESVRTTPLYARSLAYYEAKGDSRDVELFHKVWDPTPWVIDVFTGSLCDDQFCEMREWLNEICGVESWPIHDRPGDWNIGSATVNGWTWLGFKTEDMMRRFIEAFPANVRKEGVSDEQ